jgi:predicted AAA+ superfamily ATPase
VLDQFWDVENVPSLRLAARERTPESISRHGIFLDRTVLESV